MSKLLGFVLITLGVGNLWLTAHVLRRINHMGEETMKEFDDLDEAVEAINTETTALGSRIDSINNELVAAKGDPARVEAAAAKLKDVSARLKAMAQPTDAGGVQVPVANMPLSADASGVSANTVGDAGGTPPTATVDSGGDQSAGGTGGTSSGG